MSLNGLDVNAVVEAHQSALADPGGWFLLKYVNRDTVDVLRCGHGGVAEAKGVVEQYPEKSPLFGMVQYRRKKVLLKYVPEGTSRLLQVRLTVQFQSILDAFPHDTIFTFTASAELVESALGMCTMLLPTNPGSMKSSNSSVRQRRLIEISEDVEEVSILPKKQETLHVRTDTNDESKRGFEVDDLSTLPASALRAKAMLAKRKEESRNASLASNNIILSQPTPQPTPPVETPPAIAEPPRPLSSLSQLKARDEAEFAVLASKSKPQTVEQQPKRFHHSRHLSENESESISQWNEQVTAYALQEPIHKPKKKLAPKPHVEPLTRPKTANTYEENVITRPVANLPHTIRVSNRANASTHSLVRPGSQQSSRSVPARFLPSSGLPPPLPEISQLETLFKRPESRQAGSVVSSAITDAPSASPEKLRLMKALQKRKRTQILSQRSTSAQSNLTAYHDDFPLKEGAARSITPVVPIPTTIREEPASTLQEPKSAVESSTASPTSIGTMSDDPSTRPSSFAEDRQSQSSQKSASRDTDSSSTPKATTQTARSVSKRGDDQHESSFNVDERTRNDNLVREEALESRDTNTPTQRNPQFEHAPSIQEDMLTMSELTSPNEMHILQSPMHESERRMSENHLKANTLNVEALASPALTSSSVMSDDDALVEELRSATVHEAKSMSVSRPPLTPTMRTVSIDRSRPGTRSGINLTPQSSKSKRSIQERSPGVSEHSLSTALPQWPFGNDEESMAVPLSKKTTLGHGISQRIKALEDSSRRDTMSSSSLTANDSSLGRSTFTNLMKRASIIAQFQTPASSTDKTSAEEASKIASSLHQSSDKPTATRASVPRNVLQNGTEQTRGTLESSPATIRENRNPSQIRLPKPNYIELERSNPTTPKFAPPSEAFGTPFDVPTTPSSEKKRFSFASYRSGSTTPSNKKWMQSESMASKLSVSTKDNRYPRAPGSETSSVHEDKRGSRASRLMKRVSGLGGRFSGKGQQSAMTREDLRPDPIMEQNEAAGRPVSTASSVLQMIDIGDVNVQFPETLLWKRRFLRIDDQGYLIFQAPTENQSVRGTSRKFHLADIQEPCLPDLERQEMAWSVLLDLRDGNCIQCACESKKAQKKVLNMLLDAHGAYHSLYPDALD